MIRHLALVAALMTASVAAAETALPMVGPGEGDRLVYVPAARGDRVIDFSHAGYGGGGVAPPRVAAVVRVAPVSGDATAAIQAAIDKVSRLAPDMRGLRGAVLLERGTYRLDGRLRIAASGVVLRGSGKGEDGTVLVAAGHDRASLIVVEGEGAASEAAGSRRGVVGYVPAGATRLTLDGAGFSVGDTVRVLRPSTLPWIEKLGMNTFEGWRPENRMHWQAGSRDVVWERTIVAVDGATVTLDAPVTTALDPQMGGGFVYRADFAGRLTQVGVENLRLVSAYDEKRLADEDHAWFGISMDKVRDAWIRDVSARHFVSYVVNLGPDASRVTVQDVDAAEPVSEIGGFRRRVFYSAGEQVLFNRCRSDDGSHDFVLGHAAAGPNVFLDCFARDAHDDSGPIESWASGALFDNVIVRGGPLRLANRGRDGQGVGWAAANSVLWNCQTTDYEAASPPGAYNLAVGCKGVPSGDGVITDARAQPFRDFFRAEAVPPRSLYIAQLTERLGPAAVAALAPATYETSSSAPFLTASEIAAWKAAQKKPAATAFLRKEGGEFRIGDLVAWRGREGFSWFQGQMPPSLAKASGPAITRFSPGRVGEGATDRLEDVVAGMKPGDVFYHHYGLWYDRRRVDHNYFGSPDQRTGEVWGPFMELPWARSGKGRAWDGLSKYDLTKFNPWFFDRVRGFADLADREGRVLYYNFYFQHWLLESRAHYVDFPWRPVNTIQDTGLADENPAANSFYDLASPVRRDLHRRYIFHSLDTLKGAKNVVYGIDREYTGPLSFVTFWLDTIAEWEKANGQNVFVALEIPKAQMDAILDDPMRSKMIDAAAFHHWVYRPDGALFAIEGGLNLAPRQQVDNIATAADLAGGADAARVRSALWASTPAMRYRAFREYRDRRPDMVLIGVKDEFPDLTAAVERDIPAASRASMRASSVVASPVATAWGSATTSGTILVYSAAGEPVALNRPANGYRVRWASGDAGGLETVLAPGETVLVPPQGIAGKPWAALLSPR
jgi:hypothetical protein